MYHTAITEKSDNDALIDDITTVGDKPELYFDWRLEIENTATVSMENPKELALGKA